MRGHLCIAEFRAVFVARLLMSAHQHDPDRFGILFPDRKVLLKILLFCLRLLSA